MDPLVPETKVLAIASHVGTVDACTSSNGLTLNVARSSTGMLACVISSLQIPPSHGVNTPHVVEDPSSCRGHSSDQLFLARHVGNTMAAFVMQSLGCDVSALNTVQFSKHPPLPSPLFPLSSDSRYPQTPFPHPANSSLCAGNHTGYKQFRGTRATAAEILDIYEGLKLSHLTDFDVLLSGYAPSAEAVEAVGSIAKDLKRRPRRRGESGGVFWGEFV